MRGAGTRPFSERGSFFYSNRKGFGLSAGALKLLALISMTMDHFAKIVILNGKLYGYQEEYYQMAIATPEGQHWLRLAHILIFAGRLAFPLFAFLLVEGFVHTSNFWKYLARVFLFALLSEVPYDVAFFNETYNFSNQNILFTFTVGLLVLYGMKRWRKNQLLKWSSVLLGMAAAEFGHLDYGALAILMIALLYDFRKEKPLRLLCGAVLSGANSMESYGLGAIAFIPIFFYNGERGRFSLKWFFYLYYPLHIAVFFGMIYVGAQLTA